jgi:hypothetical protein
VRELVRELDRFGRGFERDGTVSDLRDRLDIQQRQIDQIRRDLDEVKAQMLLLARQLGGNPETLAFPPHALPAAQQGTAS